MAGWGAGVDSPQRGEHAEKTQRRTGLTDESKTVAVQGGDEFPCGERTQSAVVDRHGLKSHGNTGCFLRNLGNLHVVSRTFRKSPPLFEELLDDHVNHLVDVLQRLVPGAAGSG